MRLKILLKKIFLHILALTGYILLFNFWPGRRKNKLLILRYHSISDYRRHEVNLKVNAFKKQMAFLAAHYRPISLTQAVEVLKNKSQLPEKAVAVTFDDGYKDNYTNAYPILKQCAIPATVFLTAGYIGSERILPHDAYDNPAYNHLLSWDEVRQMGEGGIEFGSHTLSHANLGKKNVDMAYEIRESKRIIEKELNCAISSISYPFGLIRDFNQGVKQSAVEVGYAFGCSAMNGVNDSEADIFALRRIGIEGSDNMFTFKAKLNGCLDLLATKDNVAVSHLLKIFNRVLGV